MKTVNIIVNIIVSLFALYGLIILGRKIMLADDAVRQTKGQLGKKFFIEPFRRRCDCSACDRGDWSNCDVNCENACS